MNYIIAENNLWTDIADWLNGLWQGFYEQFNICFIEDNRWRYIFRGLGNTLIIAFCAVLMGIVLGFLVAIVRSAYDKNNKGNVSRHPFVNRIFKILNGICNVYLTVIRGTPIMLQLLIIYFVIFGSVNIPKLVVAVIAFGVNSGAYVAEIVRSGIMAIDNGQFEAGRSLGLSYPKTMIRIIAPQAFKNVLPALGNEFIVLLKETSVSGYIGLEELTRGGDIVRAQTASPFLPLLAVAAVYLAIVILFSRLVKYMERRLRQNERHNNTNG